MTPPSARDRSLAILDREERFLATLEGASRLLTELGPLLERLHADPSLRAHVEALRRETAQVTAQQLVVDNANVGRLIAIRADYPSALVEGAASEGSVHHRYSAQSFDVIAARPPEPATVTEVDDVSDPGRCKGLAFHLRVMLRIDADEDAPEKDALAARIREVEQDQEHAFNAFSIRRRTMAGFSIDRLLFVLNQINPRPEHAVGWQEYIADHLQTVLASPARLRDLVHGGARTRDEESAREATVVESLLRSELGRVVLELGRRLRDAPEGREKQQKFGILDAPTLLAADLKACEQNPSPLGAAVIFLDLDHFKALNTALTEREVDRSILPVIQRCIADAATPLGYAYAEGGDEFVVLLVNASEVIAVEAAEALRGLISNLEIAVAGTAYRVTASFGLATSETWALSELADAANRAKAEAKEQGRDRVVVARRLT